MKLAPRPSAPDESLVGPLRLGALAAAYAAGTTNPAEVVRTLAARIEARGDDGVWIHLDIPAALAAAEALGSAPDPRRPLWGVPFAVKDNIDVAGRPTTAACPEFAYVAAETATSVRRLLDAGAILVGKTNLDQFATGLNGTRSPYGMPRSAADDTLISGGSSSGSAVAVAAGLVSFSLGTDTAGSGRVPAALNGIVGVKPTRGLVSTFGVVPACRSLDCVSVFALSVADAVAVTEVVAAVDPLDPWSRVLPPPRPSAVPPLAGLRLAVPDAASLEAGAEHGYDAAWEATLSSLREAGVELVEIDLEPFFEAGRLLYEGPWVAERLSGLEEFLDGHADAALPVIRQILRHGEDFTAVEAFRAADRLRELARVAGASLGTVDALLTPTTPTTFTVVEMLDDPIARNGALGRYTTYGNLLDLAVLAVPAPAGRPDRPFGVSIAAAAGSDARIAGVGAALEALWSGSQPDLPPGDAPADVLALAVVGAHLEGMPLHGQLTERGATLTRRTRTAAEYRLVALDTVPPKPGLVRVGAGGHPIDVEVYDMPVAHVGTFLAGIAEPLGLGSVRLEDGSRVHGFLCEQIDAAEAPDISGFGGWRAYLDVR